MMKTRLLICGLVMAVGATVPASAQDFFSGLFRGFNSAPDASRMESPAMQPYAGHSLPYAAEPSSPRTNFTPARPKASADARVIVVSGGEQAFCVRTCDGRYFPISATDNQSRAASCNSFCPASETKVVVGDTIDRAATETGKPYSSLPNAFRYRAELVPGCTCNGKDQLGLASVSIDKDPTVQKGDIIANANGLMVATRSADTRGLSIKLAPATAALRAKYQRLPVVASD